MPELILDPDTTSPRGRVLNWASIIEQNTIDQAMKTARLPFVEQPVALMPDAHLGYGTTVGSVIATRGAIIPAAIGVDIGCGMIACELNLTAAQLPDDLSWLHGEISKRVPAGMGQGHNWDDAQRDAVQRHFPMGHDTLTLAQKDRALKQFGSLGGGNHFIEVCLDERDVVWIVLHSGSRGIGNELATIHIDKAKGLMKDYFITLEEPDLAYLVKDTPEFDAYIADMLWAQQYALGNREAMMDAVLAALTTELQWGWDNGLELDRINSHHNFTTLEQHHGQPLWITRKGAVRARQGDRGVIPGSMGAATFIVTGRGSAASYNSCAHGAGRVMSRGRAFKELDVEDLRSQMVGKVWNQRDAVALLDEAPAAYKSIDQVMHDQADLVEVDHALHQVLNYKGVDRGSKRRRR